MPTILPSDEARFARLVEPLAKEDFWKKRVLDAGCGWGRNSFWVVRWGAREVVAFDSDPVFAKQAKETLKNFGNAKALEADLYDISWDCEFDLAFLIGVVHRVPDPETAVHTLARTVKSKGLVFLSVPGGESKEIVFRLWRFAREVFLPQIGFPFRRVFSKEEVRALFTEADFSEAHLFRSRSKTNWTIIGVKR